METFRTTHNQFRRPLRHCGRVRARESAQPANQHCLGAVERQFGQALILSSFNYKRGEIYGGEFTSSYDHGPFSAYFNLGYEWARGTNVSSAQFLFDPDEFAFIKKNWVFLDHDQR